MRIEQAGHRPWDALRPLRIGCVKYLNSRPLIEAYDGEMLLAHPSALADQLAAGQLDAALVPIFEVLRHPIYTLVDDVAIASDGEVFSVFLAHDRPLSEVRTISLDPASRTSVHLLQVLLAEFHGVHPKCAAPSEFPSGADASLLIGNQAIEARNGYPASRHILDLGEEWKRCTGLPFVYAAWALRPGLPNPPAIADAFRELKLAGLAQIDEIVRKDPIGTPEMRREYLTEHIRFDLREREKLGINRYRELLVKHGFIAQTAPPLSFV